MAITIKEIAALTGVSIGTVDRALHNRGRVRPELAAEIKRLADLHRFEPSQAGKILSLAKNPLKIGVVVHLMDIPFMQQILIGIKKATTELANLGASVIVETIPLTDAQAQIQAIDKLIEQGVVAIAITPTESEELRQKLQQVSNKITVVTFNADIDDSGRSCYVGLDNHASGKVSASLIGKTVSEQGSIGIISGHPSNRTNLDRVAGFSEVMTLEYPELRMLDVQFSLDENNQAYEITSEMLANVPDLRGIFICSGGQGGLSRALNDALRITNVKVVAYDIVPDTIKGLHLGAIDFAIDQNAFWQGYKPLMLLWNKLFHNESFKREYYHPDIHIRIKENIKV